MRVSGVFAILPVIVPFLSLPFPVFPCLSLPLPCFGLLMVFWGWITGAERAKNEQRTNLQKNVLAKNERRTNESLPCFACLPGNCLACGVFGSGSCRRRNEQSRRTKKNKAEEQGTKKERRRNGICV